MNTDAAFAAAFGAILVGCLAFPALAEPVGAFAKVFTEGNSWAKHAAIIAFFATAFAARAVLPKKLAQKAAGQRRRATAWLALAAAIGFLAGVTLQVFVQNSLGAGPSSYISLVTGCGGPTCWEATYFQHNHLPKSAIYFLEKSAGISLPASADDGRPMYEMLSSPPISLPEAGFVLIALILAAIAALALLTALAQPSPLRAVLACAAGFTSLIAILDGGLFSLAGAASLSLLIALASLDFDFGKFDALKPIAAFAIPALVSWAPFWFLGTGLYFREWLTAPAFVASAYAFWLCRRRRDAVFLAATALLAASSMLVLSDAAGSWLGGYSNTPFMISYGIPSNASDLDVAMAAGAPLVARYGWYAAFDMESKPFNTHDKASAMRSALKPGGYLLCEAAGRTPSQQELYVVWLSPRVLLEDTASYFEVYAMQMGQLDYLRGNASIASPQLALEVGSLIQSKGGKAVVIGGVV
ncbi:MAG: hypothetical protein V1708_06165 [Candidatus Micrarchaeota archaeon]